MRLGDPFLAGVFTHPGLQREWWAVSWGQRRRKEMGSQGAEGGEQRAE